MVPFLPCNCPFLPPPPPQLKLTCYIRPCLYSTHTHTSIALEGISLEFNLNVRVSELLEYRCYSLNIHSSTAAAKIALIKTAKNHGLFQQTAKIYKVFLTAAPSFVKNERSLV